MQHSQLNNLPPCISQLTHLTSLNLSLNCFVSVPKEIFQLTGLIKLNLTANLLTSIPKEIVQLTNLTLLFLGENYFNSFPKDIIQLTNLEAFSLAGNELGSFPSEIGQCTKLTYLALCQNQLKYLPLEIGQLAKLKNLNVGYNQLSSIPAELGNLYELQYLNVEGNSGLSQLPLVLGQNSQLTHIDFKDTLIDLELVEQILNQCKLLRKKEAVSNLLPALLQKWITVSKKSYSLSFLKDTYWNDTHREILYEWLVRLERTKDFETTHQQDLACIVCKILQDLCDPSFRETFIAQASQNNENCADRASMALNELFTAWSLFKLGKDAPEQEKIDLLQRAAKTFALRNAITEKITHWEKTHEPHQETAEIYLYFEQLLKGKFNLLTATKNMRYKDVGNVPWIDSQDLSKTVEDNYLKELVRITAFEEILMSKQTYKQQKESIEDKRQKNLVSIGECPKGDEYSQEVLNWKAKMGEISKNTEEEILTLKITWAKTFLSNLAI